MRKHSTKCTQVTHKPAPVWGQVSTSRGKGVGKSSIFDDFSTPHMNATTKVVLHIDKTSTSPLTTFSRPWGSKKGSIICD